MELQTHPSPFRSTAEAAAQQNPLIMEAIDQKELLHLRIEQANDKLLEALVAMTEGLFKVYQPEVIEELVETEELAFAEEMKNVPAPAWAKPVTRDQFNAEIKESLDEYHRGEYFTLEEIEQESAA